MQATSLAPNRGGTKRASLRAGAARVAARIPLGLQGFDGERPYRSLGTARRSASEPRGGHADASTRRKVDTVMPRRLDYGAALYLAVSLFLWVVLAGHHAHAFA